MVLTAVVLPHELGHFIFALRAGIKPLELALGFPGPRLLSFKKGKTRYSIYLLPLGGFIRIAGLNPEEEKEDEEYAPEESYLNKSPLKKGLTIFGGPLMNMVFAFLLLSMVFAVFGTPVGVSNVVGTVSKGSPADLAGLMPGDKIVKLNGSPVSDMSYIVEIIHKSSGKKLVLTVERGNKAVNISATPKYNEKLEIGLIGFSPKALYKRFGILSSLWFGLKETVGMTLLVLYSLWLLITGGASLRDLAGPVGIAQFTGQAAGGGLSQLLSFTAFLSINLGVVNLLPLPALDGGRIVFIIIEAIRKKSLPVEVENKVHAVGMMVLLSLAAVLTVNDVLRWIRQ